MDKQIKDTIKTYWNDDRLMSGHWRKVTTGQVLRGSLTLRKALRKYKLKNIPAKERLELEERIEKHLRREKRPNRLSKVRPEADRK